MKPTARFWVIFIIVLIPYLLLVWRFHFLCDDSYISFRYARHLAEGHGLVFNVGESPPVEGYSNFLWVLWLSVFERMGVSSEIIAPWSSVLCGVVLLWLLLRFLRDQLALETPALFASCLFFAVLPPVAIWSTSGLETMPFALACFAVFDRLSRGHGVHAGLCAAFATVLRTDGALWALLMIGVAIAPRWRLPEARRAATVAGGVLIFTTAAHLAWRYSYYGEWVSNTALVKGELSGYRFFRGIKYVATLVLVIPPLALIPIAALVYRKKYGMSEVRLASQALAILMGVAFYSIYVGGDFMAMGRFLVVGMPFLTILFATILVRLNHRKAAVLSFACLILVFLANLNVSFVPQSLLQRFRYRWPWVLDSEIDFWRGMRARAKEWKMLGRALALHTKSGESLVIGGIGAVGYMSEIHIFDICGLTDKEVAGRKGESRDTAPGHDKAVTHEFFLGRRPTFIAACLIPTEDTPDTRILVDWEKDWGSNIVIERYPLDSTFPPRVELYLARIIQHR